MDTKAHLSTDKSNFADHLDLERTSSVGRGSIEDVNITSLGIEPVIERDISTLAIIGLGWNVTNSWAGVAVTMAFSIASGGSVVLIYGLITIWFFVGCSAATLAEIASVYPTAGGQYHWTSILAPKRFSRGLSYICGAINAWAWVATVAGVCVTVPQLITAMITFYHEDYKPQPWQIFLLFQAMNLLTMLYNIFAVKKTAWIHDVGFALSLSAFTAIFITCLARADHYQSSEFVFTTFINISGWSSDAVVFLTGLINPNYIYAGIDGAVHLAEEIKDPARAVPQALMSITFVGFSVGFAFAVAMLYCTTDFESAISTVTGIPIYEIWYQATRSRTAASVFVSMLVATGLFAAIGSQQTASRLLWSFARDNALLGSDRFFSHVHPRLGVPVWALIFDFAVVFVIGCVYLGSTTAFNAIIGTGLILQQVSYAIPAMLLLYRKRGSTYLPSTRYFKLGVFGWFANAMTVVFAVIVVIFYNFPVIQPVTSSNMNYSCVILGAMALITLANWFIHGRSHYRGPRVTFAK